MTEYAGQVRSLAEKLICILAEELGQERGALQNRLVGGPDGELTQSIRTNYYTPIAAEASPNESEGLCRLSAHSDPGGLTVLLQNDVAGFEVKKDGLWVEVEPIANALVVNIGDQIEVMYMRSPAKELMLSHYKSAATDKDFAD